MSITLVVKTFVFLFCRNLANLLNSPITLVDILPSLSIFSSDNGRGRVLHEVAHPKTFIMILRIGQMASTYKDESM